MSDNQILANKLVAIAGRCSIEQDRETIIEATTALRAGAPQAPTPASATHASHVTRFSDSSHYDEVCTQCGASDANGQEKLSQPCPKAVPSAASTDEPEPVPYEKHEAEMLKIIDEREAAQSCIDEIYFSVMGRAPQWSNMFGFTEAVDEITETVASFIAGKMPDAASTTSPEPPFDLAAFQKEAATWEDVETEEKVHHINGPFASPAVSPDPVVADHATTETPTCKDSLQVQSPEPDAVREALITVLAAWDELPPGLYTDKELAVWLNGSEMTKAIEDARAALSRPAHGGWEDISTAPKDGSQILISRPSAFPEERCHVVQWNKHDDWWEIHDGKFDHLLRGPDPTEWMALPIPRNDREGGAA